MASETAFLTDEHWITVGVTIAAVILCVFMHYEVLRGVSDWLPTPSHHRRRRIAYIMICILLLHVAEIWVFGFVYYGLLQFDGFGFLEGMDRVMLYDCVYYSAVVFSTLGFGDIIPHGSLRFVTGMESIAGLTFITWSASYTFVTMDRSWSEGRSR